MSHKKPQFIVATLGILQLAGATVAQAQLCFDLFDESTTFPLTCSDATYFIVNPDGEARTDSFSSFDTGDLDSSFDGFNIFVPPDTPPVNIAPPFSAGSQFERQNDGQGRATSFTFSQTGTVTLGPRDSSTQQIEWGNRSRISFTPVTTDDSTGDVILAIEFEFDVTLGDPSDNAGLGAAASAAGINIMSNEQPVFSFAGFADLDLDQDEEPRFFGDFDGFGGFELSEPGTDDTFDIMVRRGATLPVSPGTKLDIEVDSFGAIFTDGFESGDTSSWTSDSGATFTLTISSSPNVRFEVEGESAFVINPGLNDAWFNALTAGQGFFIIVFEDTGIIFLAWFTYDTVLPPDDVQAFLGAAEHRWLTAQGPYDGDTATLDVFLTEGGIFDMSEPAPTTGDPIGTITIVWTDCENGVLTYDIDPPGVMGEIPIRRIVPDNVALCEALANP